VKSNGDSTLHSWDPGDPGRSGYSPSRKINTCLISVWITIFRAQVEIRPKCEEHLITHLHRPRTTRSPTDIFVPGWRRDHIIRAVSCLSWRSGESSNQNSLVGSAQVRETNFLIPQILVGFSHKNPWYESLDNFLRHHEWDPLGMFFLECISKMRVRKKISECLVGLRGWVFPSPGVILEGG